MNRFLTILILFLLTVSCSIQSKLSRDFKGETIEVVKDHFPNLPYSKTPLDNEHTKFVFTKEERLAGTTISQGQTSLDPINSPSVIKMEYYIFIVDKQNVIINTKYEKDYKRL